MSVKYGAKNTTEDDIYERKYQILLKRCTEIKKETDGIYERLLISKESLGKVLYERRALKDRLDRQYRDRISHVEVPTFCEEDFAYELLISQRKTCQPSKVNSRHLNQYSVIQQIRSTSNSLSDTACSSFNANNDDTSNNNNNNCSDNNNHIKSASGGRHQSKSKNGGKKGNGNNNGNKKRNSANKKNSDAPKKPVNAYFIFCEKKRSFVYSQLVKEQSGEVDRKEVTRRLGQLWGALTDKEKNVYFDEYRKDKERYGLELEEYNLKNYGSVSGFCDVAYNVAGCSAPKKRRTSKTRPHSATSQGVPALARPSSVSASSSSAALPPLLGSEDGDNAVMLDALTGDGALFQSHGDLGMAADFPGLEMASAQSSLTSNFDKLTKSPAPTLLTTEDATDEVFLSSTRIIDSPGVANASSSGESFDHQNFIPAAAAATAVTVPQMFLQDSKEMPVS